MANDDNSSSRGFASMDESQRRAIASMGGQASPGKFTLGSRRAKEAGRKGGQRSRRTQQS